MRLSIIDSMDCCIGSRNVSYLQEIQGHLLRSHDFMDKNFNINSTHCKYVKLSHKLKEIVCIVKD